MARFTIYRNVSGVATAVAVAESLEYNGSWMGECFVTLTVKSSEPIDFKIGDYVTYRGEKFVLNYDPTVVKNARSGSSGEGFKYDGIKFNALHTELTDIMFLDYVIGDNELHYTSLPEFPFYAESIEDYLDRLQANTNRWCEANGFSITAFSTDYWLFVGPSLDRFKQRASELRYNEDEGEWEGISVLVAEDIWNAAYPNGADVADEKKDISVSVSQETIWNALARIKNDFGLNFINRGRQVIVGAAGIPSDHLFEYGKGNGLYELERTADSSQQIITALFSYGSEKNMPVRYYANIQKSAADTVPSIRRKTLTNGVYEIYFVANVPYRSGYFTQQSSSSGYIIKVKIRNTTVKARVTAFAGEESQYKGNCYIQITNDSNSGDCRETDTTELSVLYSSFIEGDLVYFVDGINSTTWPDKYSVYTDIDLPNNMAVNRLMLPGFPTMSLYDWVLANGGTAIADSHNTDSCGKASWTCNGETYTAFFSKEQYKPYILSVNYVELGYRESTKVFDGSDDTEEIYPSIEGATVDDTPCDCLVSAEMVTDNGVFDEGDNVPTVELVLPSFGSDFKLDKIAEEGTQDGGTPTIFMKDGYCGSREFKFGKENVTYNQDDDTWTVKAEREYDDLIQLYFPYSYAASHGETPQADEPYQVRGGDRFVLTGIPMTSTYINFAAKKLLVASLKFLAANDYTRYTYTPKVDELYMARQHDAYLANSENRSYYLSIKEGDIMRFNDDDLNVTGSIFIDNLVIKENDNADIPTFEVTLRNDKQVGTIQRIQNQIDSLQSSVVTAVGDGVSASTKRKIDIILSLFELDENGDVKTKDYEVDGVVKHRGLWSPSFVSALGRSDSGGGGGGASVLADLNDVEYNGTPVGGQVLKYNGSTGKWYNGTDEGITTVAWSNVTGKPTTLIGYGITDAKIEGGVITIGNNSITPLTSHQTIYALSVYGGTTKVLDFVSNSAAASLYIKAGGDITLTPNATNKEILLSYSHPTNGANRTISAADGKVLSAITVNSLGHVTSVSDKTLAAADIPNLSWNKITSDKPTTLSEYGITDGLSNATTFFGQTVSNGVVSGNMTGVGNISFASTGKNIGSVMYFDTVNSRIGVGNSSPTRKLDVNGTFYASGNSAIGGTLSVSGATTLSSSLTVDTILHAADLDLFVGNAENEKNITFIEDVRGADLSEYSEGDEIETSWHISTGGAATFSSVTTGGTLAVGSTLTVSSTTTLTGLLSANGGIVVPSGKTIKIGNGYLSWDSTNNAIRVSANADGTGAVNFYAIGGVSALGQSNSGSGGGGASSLKDLNDVSISNDKADKDILAYDAQGTHWVNVKKSTYLSGYATESWVSANFNKYSLPTASSSTLGGIKVGTTLEINASTGLLNQKSGIATAGTAGSNIDSSGNSITIPYVTVDTYGRVTGYGTHSHTVSNLPNTALMNNSVTVNGTNVSLGGSVTTSKWGTSRTLWGQSVDGSANVSGGMTGVAYIANADASASFMTFSETGFGDNGGIYVERMINFADDASFSSVVSFEEHVTMLSTLNVSGATTLDSTLSVSGATTLSSTLSAGATTLSSLSVTGAATITGSATFNGGLVTYYISHVSGGSLEIGNSSNNDWVRFVEDVCGFEDDDSTWIIHRNGSASFESLAVSTSAEIGTTLSVLGATTISNTLSVSDNVTLANAKNLFFKDSSSNQISVLNMQDNNVLVVGAGMANASRSYNTYVRGGSVTIQSYTNSDYVALATFATTGISTNVDLSVGGNIFTSSSGGAFIQIGAIRIVYDQNNNALKIVGSNGTSSANLYATGGVSALGQSSSGGGGGGGASSLADLNDVSLTSLASGDVLKYNGTHWVNVTLATLMTNYATTSWVNTNYATKTSLSGYMLRDVVDDTTYSQGIPTTNIINGDPLIDIVSLGNDGKVHIHYSKLALGSLASYDSLAFSDLTSHPTTLGNYGITDAYISNGTIYLGSNSITPLTSHQSLANYVTLNSAQTITGAKTFNEGKWVLAANDNNEITSKLWDGTTLYNCSDGAPANGASAIRNSIRFRYNDTYWVIGNAKKNATTDSYGFVIGKQNAAGTHVLNCFRVDTDGVYVNDYKVWHENNDGADSGLDADKLDGQHGSYYAKASDLSGYVTLNTTQTISGGKTFTAMPYVNNSVNNYPFIGYKSGDVWWGNIGFSTADYPAFYSPTDTRWYGFLTLKNYVSYVVYTPHCYDFISASFSYGTKSHWFLILTIPITSDYKSYSFHFTNEFYGHQHLSSFDLFVACNNSDGTDKASVYRYNSVGMGRSVAYKIVNSTLYVYVKVEGGSATGKWNISQTSGFNVITPKFEQQDTNPTDLIYASTTTNDTSGTATTLQTSRTIWGQSFNGSADVSGNMTGVGSIVMSGNLTTSQSVIAGGSDSSSGERQLKVQTSGAGNLFLFANQNGKGLYSNVVGNGETAAPKTIIGVSKDNKSVEFYGRINGNVNTATCIEFNGVGSSAGHGGYIDFHYNGSTADYTSRIIEQSSGVIGIIGALATSGAISCSATISSQAGLSTSGTLSASGNTTIGGTLGVTGATTLSSTLSAGATTLSSLTVNGATTFNNTINIGSYEQGVNVWFYGGVQISGSVTASEMEFGFIDGFHVNLLDETIDGSDYSELSTYADDNGYASLMFSYNSDNLFMGSNLYMTNLDGVWYNLYAQSISASGSLSVTGGTTLSSTLSVSGATTLSSTLSVANDITLANNKKFKVKNSGGTALSAMVMTNTNAFILGYDMIANNYVTYLRGSNVDVQVRNSSGTNTSVMTFSSGSILVNNSYPISHPTSTDLFIGNSSNAKRVKLVEDMAGWEDDDLTWELYVDGTARFKSTTVKGDFTVKDSNDNNILTYVETSQLSSSSIHAYVGFYSDSYVSALGQNTSSDIRMKDVMDYNAMPTVEQVANAPAIRYLWKDKRDLGLQVGSVAQYWQQVLPESVREDESGMLSMQYGVISLLASIATAKRIVDHEQEIERLRNRVRDLETEVEQLKTV